MFLIDHEITLKILELLADVSKAIIALHVYASESSPFALLENGIGYYAMT